MADRTGGGPSGTVLPLPPTIPLTLLTWEITGHYPKDESRNGTSERRDFLISHVHDHLVEQELKPHVVLFQEEISSEVAISPSVDSIWKGSKRYHKWLQKSECKEGTEPKFEVLTMENLADQASSLVPAGEKSEKDAFAEADKGKGFADYLYIEDGNEREMMRLELPPRAVTRKLRVTQGENEATIIVVSFYNVHKRSIEDRKRYICLFFNLMCRLAHAHQCLVLVGGDFNIHVGKWREDVEQGFPNRVHVAGRYSPTPRHSQFNITDTFAVVYPPRSRDPQRVKCWFSPPLPIYPFPVYTRESIYNRSVADSDRHNFEEVYFGENDNDKLRKLLPETRQGTPNWKVLKYDFEHDPVYVTATLQFLGF